MELLVEADLVRIAKMEPLMGEADELIRIVVASINKLKKNS